jgi:L-ascorbate metabolism protein UlaG (beta-lactamase superfamily)
MGSRLVGAVWRGAAGVAALAAALAACGTAAPADSTRTTPSAEVQSMPRNIHWLGHDSFRIEADSAVIYIDPYQLKGGPPADLILITHDHSDHCSPDDVAKIRTPETVLVTVAAAAAKLSYPVRLVAPGDELTVGGVRVQAVPAYNVDKFRSPGKPFHPREAGNVGFVLTVAGQRIYHTGDSDFIPEMKGLQVDIALLPVSGTYVMTVDEAVAAAGAIQPQLAIPMHVGRGIGTLDDARAFVEKSRVPAQVLPLEE